MKFHDFSMTIFEEFHDLHNQKKCTFKTVQPPPPEWPDLYPLCKQNPKQWVSGRSEKSEFLVFHYVKYFTARWTISGIVCQKCIRVINTFFSKEKGETFVKVQIP